MLLPSMPSFSMCTSCSEKASALVALITAVLCICRLHGGSTVLGTWGLDIAHGK